MFPKFTSIFNPQLQLGSFAQSIYLSTLVTVIKKNQICQFSFFGMHIWTDMLNRVYVACRVSLRGSFFLSTYQFMCHVHTGSIILRWSIYFIIRLRQLPAKNVSASAASNSSFSCKWIASWLSSLLGLILGMVMGTNVSSIVHRSKLFNWLRMYKLYLLESHSM